MVATVGQHGPDDSGGSAESAKRKTPKGGDKVSMRAGKRTRALARALKLPTAGDVKGTPLACEPNAT